MVDLPRQLHPASHDRCQYEGHCPSVSRTNTGVCIRASTVVALGCRFCAVRIGSYRRKRHKKRITRDVATELSVVRDVCVQLADQNVRAARLFHSNSRIDTESVDHIGVVAVAADDKRRGSCTFLMERSTQKHQHSRVVDDRTRYKQEIWPSISTALS